MALDQDKLIAYRLGRQFVREVEAILDHLPRGYAKPIDQIRRASLSITLNTAEGAGEFNANEKARFYRMARRSATEAAAVLDHLVDRGAVSEQSIRTARDLVHRIIGALTRLIQSLTGMTETAPSPPPSSSRGP